MARRHAQGDRQHRRRDEGGLGRAHWPRWLPVGATPRRDPSAFARSAAPASTGHRDPACCGSRTGCATPRRATRRSGATSPGQAVGRARAAAPGLSPRSGGNSAYTRDFGLTSAAVVPPSTGQARKCLLSTRSWCW
jgi:hypothetical protein